MDMHKKQGRLAQAVKKEPIRIKFPEPIRKIRDSSVDENNVS